MRGATHGRQADDGLVLKKGLVDKLGECQRNCVRGMSEGLCRGRVRGSVLVVY